MTFRENPDIIRLMDIGEIQKRLVEHEIDGWLLYDNHASNRFARELLHLPEQIIVTRRLFYWIPATGQPVKLLHKIEAESLDNYPGEKKLYISWSDLETKLSEILRNKGRVAMEYSPKNANPYVSVVDAGTVELIRGFGVEVVSSDDLLQHFTSVLTSEQIGMHQVAARVLEETIANVWEMLADRLRLGKKITDYDVQRFIQSEFTAKKCITEEGPICSVNLWSALPHHIATKEFPVEIQKGDYVLVDLWCKQDLPHAIYADITRVAVALPEPTPKQQQLFTIVKSAQELAFRFVQQRFANQEKVRGYEVDDVCRRYITEQGYGPNFLHRTGHNIDTQVHGAGAHLDNLETSDHRKILPGTCFSIEPGIYLEGEFGIRLEHDVVIKHNGEVEMTGGKVESIACLVS